MADAIPFTERRPLDAQTVSVFCDEWTAPKVMIYRENWNGHGSPRLTCAADGRHYWYPERMSWHPHFEISSVTATSQQPEER